MDITPQLEEGSVIIKSYGPRGFEIGEGNFFESSILININEVSGLETNDLAQINPSDLQIDEGTEIFIIGTGKDFLPIPKNIKDYLAAKNIPLEFMDTGAACRTYNILKEEGRIASALMVKT